MKVTVNVAVTVTAIENVIVATSSLQRCTCLLRHAFVRASFITVALNVMKDLLIFKYLSFENSPYPTSVPTRLVHSLGTQRSYLGRSQVEAADLWRFLVTTPPSK